MKQERRSRARVVYALIALAAVGWASATTFIGVGPAPHIFKLNPELGTRYGNSFDALVAQHQAQGRIRLANGNNCEVNPKMATCVDSSVQVNGGGLPPAGVDAMAQGVLALVATTGGISGVTCTETTYCPPPSPAQAFNVRGCIKAKCPLLTAETEMGCVIRECRATAK